MTAGERTPPAVDCRYFLGDRPCVWHKREGAVCTCARYDPIREHVLIIKLDAMGDVLRTTALLPALAAAHPHAALAWMTRTDSLPLLEHNRYLSEVIAYGADSAVHLGARIFDRVINLDAGRISAGLAALARSPRKDGYVLDPRGHVVATNPAAESWLATGIDDDLKRQGRATYQSRMLEILDLPEDGAGYVFELRPQEREAGQRHLAGLGLDPARPVVGLNTGAGGRWPLKQWREDGFLELIDRLHRERGAQAVLLGGPAEADRNRRLRQAAGATVLDPGPHPVRHFAALTACCDVVVTGDTLALHIALALGRRTVAIFGPTSAPEIEMYGLGEKIAPDMTCLSCYKTACDFVPNCMDLVSTEMVARAVGRQLDQVAGMKAVSTC